MDRYHWAPEDMVPAERRPEIIDKGYVLYTDHLAAIQELREALEYILNKCTLYGPADRAREKARSVPPEETPNSRIWRRSRRT